MPFLGSDGALNKCRICHKFFLVLVYPEFLGFIALLFLSCPFDGYFSLYSDYPPPFFSCCGVCIFLLIIKLILVQDCAVSSQ